MKVNVRISVLCLVCLAIYLFVSAPPDLPDGTVGQVEMVKISDVLDVIAFENELVREIYTREIVGEGQGVGLKFSEDWRKDDVEAGPLPALFLREAASSISARPFPLGLFLGSDQAISQSNQFSGAQAEAFKKIRETRKAQRFFAEDTQLFTAMYPDIASAPPCVKCHNGHQDSPKQDWVLNDVMGATTWTYPKTEVSLSEALALIRSTRQGFADAYRAYLTKVKGFSQEIKIGEKWPQEGKFLPSLETFLNQFEQRASAMTISRLLKLEVGALRSSSDH